MKISKVAIIFIAVIAANSYAAEAPLQKPAARAQDMITLVLEEMPQVSPGQTLPSYSSVIKAQRHEYKMPRDVAQQAQTIGHLMQEFPERNEFPIGTATTPAAMNYIVRIMQFMHRNNRLEGKDLLNELATEISIDPARIFDVLRTTNYLDLQPGVEFAARSIAKNPLAIQQLENASGYFSKQTLLPKEMLHKVARYHYLLNGKDLKGADTTNLGFSIQDYLDHNPDLIQKRQHRVLNDIFLRQNLIGLRLNNLTGLKNIPNIDQVQILNISKNQLRTLPVAAFAACTKLFSLTLSNNQLTHLNANVFDGIRSIYILDLSYNKIAQIDEATLQRLRQLTNEERMWTLAHSQSQVVYNQYQLIPHAFQSWQGRCGPEDFSLHWGPYLMLDHNLLSEANKKRIAEALGRPGRRVEIKL